MNCFHTNLTWQFFINSFFVPKSACILLNFDQLFYCLHLLLTIKIKEKIILQIKIFIMMALCYIQTLVLLFLSFTSKIAKFSIITMFLHRNLIRNCNKKLGAEASLKFYILIERKFLSHRRL